MKFYISSYQAKHRIVKVAKSIEVCLDILQGKSEVVLIQNNKAIFWPSKYEVQLSYSEWNKINSLSDYDIIEINDRGIGRRIYASQEGDPTIFTTSRCNSNCVMCPASEKERKHAVDNSINNIERLIEYLPNNLYNLVITGGEPTMIKDDFFKMMGKIKEKFQYTKVLLLTNGRSLSNRSFFNQFTDVIPNHIRVAVPIHGHNAELHDMITQVPGSFEQTLAGITNLLEAKLEVEIRIVINKMNCDYLSEIAALIINRFKGVFCVNLVGLEVRGNCAKNASNVFVDYVTASNKMLPAIDLFINNGIDVGIYNFPLCFIDKKYWAIAAKSIAGYKSKFYEKCELCDVKSSCCGIFQASMTFIKPEVYPIKMQNRAI